MTEPERGGSPVPFATWRQSASSAQELGAFAKLHPYPGTDATFQLKIEAGVSSHAAQNTEKRTGESGARLKKRVTIAELGRLSGVGVETVRYYQRLGLISVPSVRDLRSHRRYGADAVAELNFVRRCKELGFSLKEIAVLAKLRRSPRGSCTALHERLCDLSAALDAKWKQLASQREAVRSLLEACGGGKSLAECEAYARIQEGTAADAETGQ